MSFDYDVIIIGAGPIGSTLAYKLALDNINVCLIDRKKEIGIPLQCAGIVSEEIKTLSELPDDIILNNVRGACIHSPNSQLMVHKDKTAAYIIDRVNYDKFLFENVKKHNVTIFMDEAVLDVDTSEGLVKTVNRCLKGKVVVAADGANSKMYMKLNKNIKHYVASQFLVKIIEEDNNNDFVDLFTDSEYFPGFIWKIPLRNNFYRVGIFTNKTFNQEKLLLNDFINKNYSNYEILDEYYGQIPVYNKDCVLVENRLLLIGDAATQVKPTTGGGLILGLKSTDIAENVIKEVLKEDNINFLKNYEKIFKKQFGKELKTQLNVQKTLSLLSNDDLDYFFLKLKEKNLEQLISEYGEIDNQSKLVKEIIKRGYLFTLFPKLLLKNISRIWGIR